MLRGHLDTAQESGCSLPGSQLFHAQLSAAPMLRGHLDTEQESAAQCPEVSYTNKGLKLHHPPWWSPIPCPALPRSQLHPLYRSQLHPQLCAVSNGSILIVSIDTFGLIFLMLSIHQSKILYFWSYVSTIDHKNLIWPMAIDPSVHTQLIKPTI
jgi:hypothetical protein